jgi:hypothetical protein
LGTFATLLACWALAPAAPGPPPAPAPAPPPAPAEAPPPAPAAGSPAAPAQVLRGDLDGDGAAEGVQVYLKEGAERGFLRVLPPPGRPGAPWTSAIYPMWAAWVADLDGDGRAEVLVGTWTRQVRHGLGGKRRGLTVLTWDRGALVPRWRGSALARPIADLAVADLDGDPRASELLALERTPRRCTLTGYRFDGFGFKGIGRRGWAVGAATGCGGVTLCGGRCVDTPQGRRRAAVRGATMVLLPQEEAR